MLEVKAIAIYTIDGKLDHYELPTLIKGDDKSVKLEVSFYEDLEKTKLLDLTNYIVEAVVERPNGSVSPALTLSIDSSERTKKYLLINSWMTEFAGTNRFTIRLKEQETIKATGRLSLVIGDGNVPNDTVITEPQHEALQEAIQAETQNRTEAFDYLNEKINNETTARQTKDQLLDENITNINSEIVRVDNATKAIAEATGKAHEFIEQEIKDRKTVVSEVDAKASQNQGEIERTNQSLGIANRNIDTLFASKLDKTWQYVPLINELADDDYFVINSGNIAYKLTVSNLKQLLGAGTGGGGVNHYKGDYLTYEALVSANPSAEAGDYAFVNTETESGDLLVMYIWDADAETWKETKSDQYVLSTSFVNFQNALLTGVTIVKKADSTYKYITAEGQEVNIESSFNALKNDIIFGNIVVGVANAYVETDSEGVPAYNNIAESFKTLGTNLQRINESLANKQDTLEAGTGIKIENNTISVVFPDNTEQVAGLQEQITTNKGSIDNLTENVTQIEVNVETNAEDIEELQNNQNAFITGTKEVKVATTAKEATTATNYKKSTGDTANIESALTKIINDILYGNLVAYAANNYVETDSEGTPTYVSIDEALKGVNAKLALSEGTLDTLGSNINTLNADMADVKDNKLNKKWDDISVINELADDDYFILNSGAKAFKVTVASMRELLDMSGRVNHYKGDYLSLSALQTANPTANAGDYAFVNTTTDNGDILIMYIWDADANVWKQTKSDQYVLSNTFVDFSNGLVAAFEGLQDGSIIVKCADSYIDAGGTTQEFQTKFHEVDEKITSNTTAIAQANTQINNLENNKQNKLIAGENIEITDGNVINANIETIDTYDYIIDTNGLRKYYNDGSFGSVINSSPLQSISSNFTSNDYGILMNWFRTTVLGLGVNYVAQGIRGKMSARGKFLNELESGQTHVLFTILSQMIGIAVTNIDSLVVECIGEEISNAECTMVIDLYTKQAQHYRLQVCATYVDGTTTFITDGWKQVDYNAFEVVDGLKTDVDGLSNDVTTLQETSADHEQRIATLEAGGGSSGGSGGGSGSGGGTPMKTLELDLEGNVELDSENFTAIITNAEQKQKFVSFMMENIVNIPQTEEDLVNMPFLGLKPNKYLSLSYQIPVGIDESTTQNVGFVTSNAVSCFLSGLDTLYIQAIEIEGPLGDSATVDLQTRITWDTINETIKITNLAFGQMKKLYISVIDESSGNSSNGESSSGSSNSSNSNWIPKNNNFISNHLQPVYFKFLGLQEGVLNAVALGQMIEASAYIYVYKLEGSVCIATGEKISEDLDNSKFATATLVDSAENIYSFTFLSAMAGQTIEPYSNSSAYIVEANIPKTWWFVGAKSETNTQITFANVGDLRNKMLHIRLFEEGKLGVEIGQTTFLMSNGASSHFVMNCYHDNFGFCQIYLTAYVADDGALFTFVANTFSNPDFEEVFVGMGVGIYLYASEVL